MQAKEKAVGTAAGKAKKKRVSMVADDYNHVHKRVYIEGKAKMKSPPEEQDKLADEFVKIVINILNNAQIVDPSFVLVSKHDGKFPWISQPN